MRSPRRRFRRFLGRVDARWGRRRRVRITQAVAIVVVALTIVAEVGFLVAADRNDGGRTEAAQPSANTARAATTQARVSSAPDETATATAPAATAAPPVAAEPDSSPPAPTPAGATNSTPSTGAATDALVKLFGPAAAGAASGPVAGSASIFLDPDSCTWEPSAGGTLRAAGSVTDPGPDDDAWLVDVTWIENGSLYDSESMFVDTTPGQTQPWEISLTGAEAPVGTLTCSVELS